MQQPPAPRDEALHCFYITARPRFRRDHGTANVALALARILYPQSANPPRSYVSRLLRGEFGQSRTWKRLLPYLTAEEQTLLTLVKYTGKKYSKK